MKKLTVNRLALGNLRVRKKQYTTLLIGIILSMVFSSGVTFFVSTLITSIQESRYNAFGQQDVILFGVDERCINKYRDEGVLAETARAEELGFMYSDEESKGCAVAKYSEEAAKLYRIRVREGRLPTQSGEIAIERDALLRLGLDISVGDTFKSRFAVADGNGFLPEHTEKSYTLVGILYDKRTIYEKHGYGMGYEEYPAAVVSEQEKVDAGGKCREIYYCNLNKTGAYGKLYQKIVETCDQEYPGSDILSSMWMTVSGTTEYMRIRDTSLLSITLAAVLMLISCIGIVNSFHSNLEDRKKQIGFMRAVGATKRQIIMVFGREAVIIALLCTPFSVLISYFATKLIITFMGEQYVFQPKLWVLALCAAAGVMCVLLAALIPLVRASKVSPMLAIRNTEYTRKLRKKRIKPSKSFVVPKLIAKRESTFSRGRITAVSIILILSVLLGTVAFSFVQVDYQNFTYDHDYYLVNQGFGCTYGNYQSDTKGLNSNIVQEIRSCPYVSDVYATENRSILWLIDEPTKMQRIYLSGDNLILDERALSALPELNTENYFSVIRERKMKEEYEGTEQRILREKFGYGEYFLNCGFIGREEQLLKKAKAQVVEGEIDIDKLNAGEEIILCIPQKTDYYIQFHNGSFRMGQFAIRDSAVNYVTYDRSIEKEVLLDSAERDIHAGDTVELSFLLNTQPSEIFGDQTYDRMKEHRKTVTVGAIVTPGAFEDHNYIPELSFVTTNRGYLHFTDKSRPTSVEIKLKKECDAETDEIMKGLIEPLISGRDVFYDSIFADRQELAVSQKKLLVALISVILLFFTLCASLVNNAMNTRIRANKRQMGTLRAVGMSARELTASYIRQMLSMFRYGLLGGFGSYHIFYFALRIWAKRTGKTMPIEYFVLPSLLLCAVIFAVCCFNLYRQIRKQMKYSIVDNIREL